MKPYELLFNRFANIEKLKKLKKDVDPASGMSVQIRRGVLSDRCEEEDDRELREWVQLETAEHMDAILDLLIATQVKSLGVWERAAREDITANEKALAALAKYKGANHG